MKPLEPSLDPLWIPGALIVRMLVPIRQYLLEIPSRVARECFRRAPALRGCSVWTLDRLPVAVVCENFVAGGIMTIRA